MTSKSRKKKVTITCVSCESNTEWFVAILKNNSGRSTQKHWYVCLNCYEEDKWQTVTRAKEHTTKSGLSIGLTKSKRRSKRNASPSQAVWEENILATSSFKSKDLKW